MSHVSANQIKNFRRCKRLIGFEYVEKIKPPPKPKQSFGSAVHKQLENWLKNAIVPDDTPEGNTAKQGILENWLPVPGPKLLVEHPFDVEWHDGIRVVGFIDCASPADRLVIDHKTTSNLQYAMDQNQLHQDPQALLYAAWASAEWNSSTITARWIYYCAANPLSGPRKPNGKKLVEVRFDFSLSEDLALLQQLDTDINEIYTIKANCVPGNELPPNPRACQDYGGCPHRERCNLQPDDVLVAFLEKIK